MRKMRRAEPAEADHLDDHRERLDHEDPADQEQQDLGLRHDRERRRARPPSPIEPVSPMKTWAGNALYQRNPIEAPIRLAPRMARSRSAGVAADAPPADDPGDDAHGRVREERDRDRAGREPVEAVGQVHAVRGAGDHHEEEHVPAPRERRRRRRRAARRRPSRSRARGTTTPTKTVIRASSRSFQRPRRPSERRCVSFIQSSAKPIAAQARVTKKTVSASSVRSEKIRNGSDIDDHDQQAAHRRRPLLDHVPCGPLLADLLPELVAAQELDELRAGDDRDDHREDAREEDLNHAPLPRRRAPSRARRRRPRGPSTREPLTSTQSPGCRSRGASGSPPRRRAPSGVSGTASAPSR